MQGWRMHATGWRLGHRPSLDAIRGVACLLVVAAHASWLPAAAGPIGVSMFFALSGFLITALLLGERERFGRVSLRGFYLRRAARLLPALVVVLATAGVAGVAMGKVEWWQIWSALLYVANWAWMDEGGKGALVHTWSLSIEEQFYLVWPAVLLVAASRGRRVALGVCIVGIAASLATKGTLLLTGADGGRIYFGSDTRADALLWGALIAVLLTGRSTSVRRQVPAAWGLGIVVFGCLLVTAPDVKLVVVPSLVSASCAVAIWGFTRGPGGGAPRWLVAVGQRSYGLYLWHMPLLSLGEGHAPTWALVAAAGVATEVSWRLVEQPATRWARHRSQHAREHLVVRSDHMA